LKKAVSHKKYGSVATNKLNYPHCYDVHEVNNGIKSSFGISMLATTNTGLNPTCKSEMSRRSLPTHLRTQRFTVPGPGTYKAKDSV
jgi:hypothetical protein